MPTDPLEARAFAIRRSYNDAPPTPIQNPALLDHPTMNMLQKGGQPCATVGNDVSQRCVRLVIPRSVTRNITHNFN